MKVLGEVVVEALNEKEVGGSGIVEVEALGTREVGVELLLC